jgi:hypothetical protein
MFLVLAVLFVAVVWGFFHANPKGVSRAGLRGYNAAALALAVGAGAAVGLMLHGDALARKPDEAFLAATLAIMAGGALFMIVVLVAGLIRNLLVFPLSRRRAA